MIGVILALLGLMWSSTSIGCLAYVHYPVQTSCGFITLFLLYVLVSPCEIYKQWKTLKLSRIHKIINTLLSSTVSGYLMYLVITLMLRVHNFGNDPLNAAWEPAFNPDGLLVNGGLCVLPFVIVVYMWVWITTLADARELKTTLEKINRSRRNRLINTKVRRAFDYRIFYLEISAVSGGSSEKRLDLYKDAKPWETVKRDDLCDSEVWG